MSKIIGGFVFRDEGDGCLTSKFLATVDDTPYTETCKRNVDSISTEPFVGIYRTIWLQPDNTFIATLTIERVGDIYTLNWNDLRSDLRGASTLRYRGRAMMFEGKLVGSYWSI